MNTDNKIDFQALENFRLSTTFIQAVKQTFQSRRYWFVNLCWALVSIPYLFFTLVSPIEGEEIPLGVLGYFPLIFIIWVWYYVYKLRSNKMKLFAASNNWKIRKYDYEEPLPITLALSELGNGVSDVLEMSIDNIRWDLFCLDWPSNKQQFFTVFRCKIDKELAPMVLDSFATKGVLSIPENWSKIDLEGDFAKTFKLYIAEGSQVDVLSYMAPDLMYLLDQNNRLNDLEISNGHLFVISDSESRDADSLRYIIPTLSMVYNKLT